MSDHHDILERALASGDKDAITSAYREWAANYDADLTGKMDYVAPAIAGGLLMEHLDDPSAEVLDAGCGTGLAGACLHRAGYRLLDGLDYSVDMLEQARAKGIYRSLDQGDLTSRLAIADDRYDAVLCVGTFTCGHVGPQALHELIRIIRPGGHICFTVRDRAWAEDDYAREIAAITDAGRWQEIETRTTDYIREEGSQGQVCLYRVA
ncbi:MULTISPECIES: class I SAM-dependent methyltransferase [unclassified Marichromatium]|uniref:class I SAM-dependent DNA methyltransferase n=1 Tax=unclassified Marichromatium TaxID=2618417 RepID=UPI000F412765|nr:class I SAM-dependent methyltransferase [Marichromatium sp. AB31]MBO8085375.1 class I SAM-dependent methyltransferase [Marichromatium sp.]RNE91206.1 class I SAM-dependent methyltransferase [Marichromatium sp. AB31]